MVDLSKHMSNFELHTAPTQQFAVLLEKDDIIPSYYVKIRIVPEEGTRPHFLQALSIGSVAVRAKIQHGEDSGILTMVMQNEWDSFPASNLMMLSIFLVILKLTQS